MRDPGALWRNQPQEKLEMTVQQLMTRRTQQLYSMTRSEIVTAIAGTLFFVAVVAWRFAGTQQRLLQVGLLVVVAWIAVTAYWFRDRIRGRGFTGTCLEHYRKELERRRDHLRNVWLWHGPALLACLILVATLMGNAFPSYQRLGKMAPFLLLLVTWTVYGVWRRRRAAQAIQREIDELDQPQ
jgi:cbb3-type cytochrome oxidase subunit 3